MRSSKIRMVCYSQLCVSPCLALGCPVSWVHMFLGIPVEVCLDEMNI